jgi:hypothetical protein
MEWLYLYFNLPLSYQIKPVWSYTQKHVKIKNKAIPLQVLTSPEGSRRLRLPDFKTIVI